MERVIKRNAITRPKIFPATFEIYLGFAMFYPHIYHPIPDPLKFLFLPPFQKAR